MKISYQIIALLLLAMLSGCVQSTSVMQSNEAEEYITTGLSSRDFAQAADEATQSMLSSGAVTPVNGRKNILVISNILNDTMQNIDTDQLVKKIRIALLQSGQVKTTTAIGLNGSEDKMNDVYGQLARSKKINKKTLKRQSLTAPNMSLSGKIIQRNNRTAKGKQLIEYYFQLTLTDLGDGLAIWEGETPIRKLADKDTVSW
ncbi:MAG: penicillin-binding protein activator LpoB [Desulfotalea sp.]